MRNPWDDFKAEHDGHRKPTLRSLVRGYLMALVLCVIASMIMGIFFLFYAIGRAGGHIGDHVFNWAVPFVIAGSVFYGIGAWVRGVWVEIRTRHHLERYAQETEEHLRAKENNNPFAHLIDERERYEKDAAFRMESNHGERRS